MLQILQLISSGNKVINGQKKFIVCDYIELAYYNINFLTLLKAVFLSTYVCIRQEDAVERIHLFKIIYRHNRRGLLRNKNTGFKNIYRGKEEIAWGTQYIETHWQEPFDLGETARAACLSKAHFTKLFKKYAFHTGHERICGITPDRRQLKNWINPEII